MILRRPNDDDNNDTSLSAMGLSGHADPAAVLGVTISFTILAFTAVALRMYSRIFIVHSPGKDDAFIVGAVIMTICLTIAQGFQGPQHYPQPFNLNTRLTVHPQSNTAWAGTSTT